MVPPLEPNAMAAILALLQPNILDHVLLILGSVQVTGD
jgi:hypothetical protein